jgi:predicted HTH domain antitoxin
LYHICLHENNYAQSSGRNDEKEVKMIVASALFEKGILSSGQAAAFVGVTKREFLETVGNYGVSIFGETIADLKRPFPDT